MFSIMSKSYKVSKKTMNMGPKKGKTVYSVRPYSYGTLTTKDIANQIAMESTATPADVMAVLDRYTYYVKENLKKGYDIELFGFGKLYLRFLTGKAVEKEKDATAKLVKSILPAFRPSYYLLKNGSRVYNLIPDSIELVKYGDEKKDKPTGGTTDGEKKPTTGDSTNGGENAGGENTGGENTGGSENTGGTGSESGDNVNF